MPSVLFVDDEPNILAAYERNLRREGYELVMAASAQLGLRILESRSIDVVISDERMPGNVSGTDFLRSVRRLFPSTMRLMVTGETNIAVAAKAIEDGLLYRYLTKPVKTEELAAAIRNALNLHRLNLLSRANHNGERT